MRWYVANGIVTHNCVVAGLDHALQTISAALGGSRKNWTDAQLLAFYQTQNPGFSGWGDAGGPDDGGMVVQDFLNHLVHTGEILAFGSVDHSNEEALKGAIYVGLALVTGETLQVAQQSQKTWDYVAGSGTWGGHCTCSVGFKGSPDEEGLVTWGAVVDATENFISHQVEEAWFILTTDMVNHPGFRDSFDLVGFAAAVAELTNGKVVVPVDPPAPVPPGPGPTPDPPPDPLADFPFAALDHWAGHPHVWRPSRVAADQYRAWKTRHGL
jgi:hypothetical protein